MASAHLAVVPAGALLVSLPQPASLVEMIVRMRRYKRRGMFIPHLRGGGL